MSLGGGRRENFFLSLLEYYPEKKRWFLKSLHQVRDEEIQDRDAIIASWVDQYGLLDLIVDFPLSRPPCEEACLNNCTGAHACPRREVIEVRSEMEKLLDEDAEFERCNPKKYEQDRVASLELDYSKDLKLRKGFVPYWHRPLDVWIWKNYYDQLLEVFKMSYDSFGNVSVMLLARLKYLVRHLPRDLKMYESSIEICLIELYRARIIKKTTMYQLLDLELAPAAREMIVQQIEQNMDIFIYENDLDTITKNGQAFDSFILSVVGQRMLMNGLREIPDWGTSDGANFIVPSFLAQG